MSWIKTINYLEAQGTLKKLYNRVKGANNYIDNILKVHSLRPHTLKGHMVLYKNVLHHRDNHIPKWFLETLGVYVSHLNNCEYCVSHHFAGLTRLLNDAVKSEAIRQALESENFSIFDSKEQALIVYAKNLTLNPGRFNDGSVEDLKRVGWSDGEILEANQVISYFNYANRTVLGLGVSLKGDILGLSPNDNDSEENWGHS